MDGNGTFPSRGSATTSGPLPYCTRPYRPTDRSRLRDLGDYCPDLPGAIVSRQWLLQSHGSRCSLGPPRIRGLLGSRSANRHRSTSTSRARAGTTAFDHPTTTRYRATIFGLGLGILATILSGAACESSRTSTTPTSRPTLVAGCAISASRSGSTYSPDFGSGPAYGPGPVYAIAPGGLGPSQDGWQATKILWIAAPQVAGSILISGRQRGGDSVRWNGGTTGSASLDWVATNNNTLKWSSLPSNMYVKTPGCFELDIEITGGHETIVLALS